MKPTAELRKVIADHALAGQWYIDGPKPPAMRYQVQCRCGEMFIGERISEVPPDWVSHVMDALPK